MSSLFKRPYLGQLIAATELGGCMVVPPVSPHLQTVALLPSEAIPAVIRRPAVITAVRCSNSVATADPEIGDIRQFAYHTAQTVSVRLVTGSLHCHRPTDTPAFRWNDGRVPVPRRATDFPREWYAIGKYPDQMNFRYSGAERMSKFTRVELY